MTNFENLKKSTIDEMADFIAITIMASSCGVFGFDKMTSDMLRSLPIYKDMVCEVKSFLEKEVGNE